MIPWMVMHAAASFSRFNMGKDGKTPYERVTGNQCQKNPIDFGEYVAGLRPDSKDKFMVGVRWLNGVYLGMLDRTDEHLIGTPEGVIQVHTISRTCTTEQQWDNYEMLKVKGVPWEPVPGRAGIHIKPMIDMSSAREPPQTCRHMIG